MKNSKRNYLCLLTIYQPYQRPGSPMSGIWRHPNGVRPYVPLIRCIRLLTSEIVFTPFLSLFQLKAFGQYRQTAYYSVDLWRWLKRVQPGLHHWGSAVAFHDYEM